MLLVFHHDPVWNTKVLVAQVSETCVSSCILLHLLRLIVDTAIEFNNQPKFMAIEINDEILDWNLTTKLESKHAAMSQ